MAKISKILKMDRMPRVRSTIAFAIPERFTTCCGCGSYGSREKCSSSPRCVLRNLLISHWYLTRGAGVYIRLLHHRPAGKLDSFTEHPTSSLPLLPTPFRT